MMNWHLPIPICISLAGLQGGTARQALVGGAWHAPLPLLLQTPFAHAPRLYASVAALFAGVAAFRFFRRLAALPAAPPSGDQDRSPSRSEHLLSPIPYLLSPICAVAAAMATALSSSPAATAVFLYSFMKIADWSLRRRLRDWVLLSLSLGALLLCGLPYIGWVVAMLALLPLLLATDKNIRPRTGGLMFLCAAPVAYAAGCWILLSRLIFSDPFFAWRFVPHLSVAALPRGSLYTAGATGLCALVFLLWRRVASQAKASLCAATAAAALWFGLLSSCGLDWALPWGAPANLPPPDRDAIARHVKEATPWGRIFVCGYAGLGGRCADPADDALFEQALDPHIAALRKAYTRQRLYILVPRPERENALEPPEWRYRGLYANGAQRLLFDEDFGPWRLYEVVSAEF